MFLREINTSYYEKNKILGVIIMINYIKNDFNNVRAALSCMFGKNIPVGIVIPYYIIVGLLTLPLSLVAIIVWKIIQIRIKKINGESLGSFFSR